VGKQGRKPRPQPAQGRGLKFLLTAATLGTVAVAILSWVWFSSQDAPSAAPLHTGGPRLSVETDNLDFGDVRFEKRVIAEFRLQNVGDRPLQIAARPAVEVVEGC
jgi:hypothetical protein